MDVTQITDYLDKVELFQILLPLTFVFCFAKFFGFVARKLHMSQVVGEIIAGFIVEPCIPWSYRF